MAYSNVPEPWASAMDAVGAVSPQTGRPSLNALGQRAGVHTTTVSNLVQGRTREPDLDTVTKLARALRKPVRVVASWVGINWVEDRPYVPPKEADLLDAGDRELVDTLIRSLARQKTGMSPEEAAEADHGRQPRLFSHNT